MKTCIALCCCASLFAQAPPEPKPPYQLTDAERGTLQTRIAELKNAVARVHTDPATRADIAIYLKAAESMMKFEEEFFTKDYVNHTMRVLDIGFDRARQPGRWATEKGRLCRAYTSRVDGSLQPYCLTIPPSYDPKVPTRLDVVLHGRAATMTEASFLAQHHSAKPVEEGISQIQLEVFGRGNNAYRWAGETDVFEALDSVRGRYTIDPKQIVLRGFSMGGAGAWHLGLHYPCSWSAMEAGAGFNETRKYAHLETIPEWQAKTLHIYDAFEYALNAFNLPVVGYGGEIDPQLQASRNIQTQLTAEKLAPEALRALFLVGPQTPHRWHPDSKKQSDAFLNQALDRQPAGRDRIRFVTYTTRYNACDWLTVEGLEKHYERAEIDARKEAKQVIATTRNIARLSFPSTTAAVLDGQKLSGQTFERTGQTWRRARKDSGPRKQPGLQGPVDDAFLDAFVCVRPQGGDARLDRFAREWAKYMRGDLPVRDASEISAEDLRDRHLILFGDQETNPLIAQLWSRLPAGKLPGATDPGNQVVLIYPNPLNPSRYVVLNSGHTFGEKDFRGTNALLYPRVGDWAVVKRASGEVVASGFFDENWR